MCSAFVWQHNSLPCKKAYPMHRQLEVTLTPVTQFKASSVWLFDSWLTHSLPGGDKCCWEDNVDLLDYSCEGLFQNNKQKTLVCLSVWIELEVDREGSGVLYIGWQVDWRVNCLGVQWVYSDHKQRAPSSWVWSFKSKRVKSSLEQHSLIAML